VGRVGVLLVRQSVRSDTSAAVSTSGRVYQLGVEIGSGVGRFRRSKIITFVPRFTLVNDTRLPLEFQQLRCGLAPEMLSSKSSVPFHWPRANAPERLCVRCVAVDAAWEWSKGFPITDLGTFHLKLTSLRTSDVRLLKVDVVLHNSAIRVVFSDGTDLPPFRIDNRSLVPLVFHQQDVENIIEVPPATASAYAWDDLSKGLHLVLRVKNAPHNFARVYDPQRIYEGPMLRYPQWFYIVGPNGLVVGAKAVGMSGQGAAQNSVVAVMCKRQAEDLHQAWQLTPQNRLRNRAGYLLQVLFGINYECLCEILSHLFAL
jgi:hypothetical protein